MTTWHKLESEFKELGKQMIYTRLDVQWGAAGEYWHLAGSFDRNTDKRFAALASIAGQKLASVLNPSVEIENELLREPNHSFRWYKGIWKISQNFEFGFIGEQTNNDGTSAGHIYTGTINKIADAAATFCLELAARYPESEEEKKTQAPPSELSDRNLSGATHSMNSTETRVDKYLQKAKNHPYISLLILFGIIIISLAQFTDAINKLIDLFPFSQNKAVSENKAASSQTNTNNSGNSININRSNNVTINQIQNIKSEAAQDNIRRLKESLRSLDAIESHVEIAIEPEPNQYLALLERARNDIKNIRNINGRTRDLVMKTYDCYHETGEIWMDNSPSALQSNGVTSLYDDALHQFERDGRPKLYDKWRECADYLKNAYEYLEME